MMNISPFYSLVNAQNSNSNKRSQTMSLDVKDTEITDVIRMISKGYGLNIILDRDISGKVTLHLTDAPIIEGLNTLAESNGWELIKEGSVYRIRKPIAQTKSSVRFSRGKLTVDLQNIDVTDFIKEVSSKTAVSIVQDSKLKGTVSGKLYQVPLEDGLKAILEANGFEVTKRKNIFMVSSSSSGSTTSSRSSRFSSSRRSSSPTGGGGIKDINYSDGYLTIDVANGNLEDVINIIADESETEIIIYGRLSGEVNAKLDSISLTEGLALLLGGTKFTFIQKDNVILIGDRNTASHSGKTLSTSELIHLRHIKADEVPKILPKNVPAANVKVIKEQNALLVSGTSEDIVKTREFLNTIDIPTPQVTIEALVVEYTRNIDKDIHFEFAGNLPPSSNGQGVKSTNYFSFPNIEINRNRSGVAKILKNIGFSQSIVDKLPDDFYASLRLLEQEQKAKLLAHPSITVLNGNKAKIDVGQTQYFKVLGGTEQNPTENFRPIKFGINLNITPWISKSGQITAEITPEISNSTGINQQGYPDVSTRSISTTVRIDNGKTLILGGLLKTEHKLTHSKVPILGDIPIIGYLFKSTKNLRNQTNLVIYITPKIINKNEYVDLDEEIEKFDFGAKKGIFERSKSEEVIELISEEKESFDSGDSSSSDSMRPDLQNREDNTGIGKKKLMESGSDTTSAIKTRREERKERRLRSRRLKKKE
jgi:type IV pilus assembly protein PilQ